MLPPKNFFIRCKKCNWGRTSSGVSEDLKDLHEIKNSCKDCGKFRSFRCPKCGGVCNMKRIKGNA